VKRPYFRPFRRRPVNLLNIHSPWFGENFAKISPFLPSCGLPTSGLVFGILRINGLRLDFRIAIDISSRIRTRVHRLGKSCIAHRTS